MKYSIASPSTWQFEKDGEKYGGFEEVVFSQAQKNEIESLGGQLFDTVQDFKNWEVGSSPVEIVKKDIAFGQKLILRFLSENKQADITTEESLSQMAAFQNAKMALEVGAIGSALYLIELLPPESFFVTPGYKTGDERKQSFIDEINGYRK